MLSPCFAPAVYGVKGNGHLLQSGFEKVLHLKGGILKILGRGRCVSDKVVRRLFRF